MSGLQQATDHTRPRPVLQLQGIQHRSFLTMTPQTHTRYRVQKLIRLGEWLEDNADVLVSLVDSVDETHTEMCESEELSKSEDSYLVSKMMSPMLALQKVAMELRSRHNNDKFDVKRGTDVTLYHPYAPAGKRYEVVMPAPTAKLTAVNTKTPGKKS